MLLINPNNLFHLKLKVFKVHLCSETWPIPHSFLKGGEGTLKNGICHCSASLDFYRILHAFLSWVTKAPFCNGWFCYLTVLIKILVAVVMTQFLRQFGVNASGFEFGRKKLVWDWRDFFWSYVTCTLISVVLV